jgi:hypothetical protein
MTPKRIGPMLQSQTMPEQPCYFRALLQRGLIDQDTTHEKAFDIFWWLRYQPEVQAAYVKAEKQKLPKKTQIPAFFALYCAAIDLLTQEEIHSIALRMLYQTKSERVREYR